MTETERVDGTRQRLSKPDADAAMVEIGEGNTRRMVRRVSVDTIDRMIRCNRLQKPQIAASDELARLRAIIGFPLSASRYEASSPSSDDMSQYKAVAMAEWNNLQNMLSRTMHGHVLVWVFVEGVNVETVGYRLNPKLKSRSRKIETGDAGVLKALDAAASYFGF